MRIPTINKEKTIARVKDASILWILVAMCLILTRLTDSFLTPLNVVTVLKQISILGIVAAGSTFTIITGGIDMSCGSIMALSGVCAAFVGQADSGLPLILAVLVAIAVGGLVGLLNGVGISYGKIPPFIMTLGTMTSVRGFALLLTDGMPIFNLQANFPELVNYAVFNIGDVKVPVIIFFLIGIIALSSVLLNHTTFGKHVMALGGNAEAARFSGVNVKLVRTIVYVYSGLLAGLAGVLMAALINSGNATIADSYAMDAISASVIGGVSMSGGIGTIWKTIVGALIIGVMQNGLQILKVSSFIQTIVQGAIIVIAVYLDVRTSKKK